MHVVLDLPYGESLVIDPDNGEPRIEGRRGGATHPSNLRGSPDGARIHDILAAEEERRREVGAHTTRDFWAIVRAKLYLQWNEKSRRFEEGAVA